MNINCLLESTYTPPSPKKEQRETGAIEDSTFACYFLCRLLLTCGSLQVQNGALDRQSGPLPRQFCP